MLPGVIGCKGAALGMLPGSTSSVFSVCIERLQPSRCKQPLKGVFSDSTALLASMYSSFLK